MIQCLGRSLPACVTISNRTDCSPWGTGTMAVLRTRASLAAQGDDSLCPLSALQAPPEQGYQLHLICHHPEQSHLVGNGYGLRAVADWWLAVSPWLHRLVIVLKMLPVGNAVSDIYNAAGIELIQKQRARMEEMSSRIPRPGKLDTFSEAVIDSHMYAPRLTGNRRSSASLAPVFDPGRSSAHMGRLEQNGHPGREYSLSRLLFPLYEPERINAFLAQIER